MKKTGFSLKYKLMALLTGLSAFALISFGILAMNDFAKDKIAYVFDSTQAQSINTAQQVRTEVETAINRIQFFLDNINSADLKISSQKRKDFNNDSLFAFLSVYKVEKGQIFTKKEELTKKSLLPEQLEVIKSSTEPLIRQAIKSNVSLKLLPGEEHRWMMALKTGPQKKSSDSVIIVAVINQGTFVEKFLNGGLQDIFLIGDDDQIVIEPFERVYNNLNLNAVTKAITSTAKKIKSEYGIRQVKLPNNTDSLLVSVGNVGIGNFKVASFVPQSRALQAIERIKLKVILFLVLMICVTIFISVISSNKLTFALNQLTMATRQIATGDFNLKLTSKAKDEIGELSTNFNTMAVEIERLVKETAEKSRMEGELKTAKLVQTTLFPEPTYKDEAIEIAGFYEPASECGGDWWFHSHFNGLTYLWIGDATGHGAPAALVTAAARAAASTVENIGSLPPEQIVSLLNKAIYNTAGGKVLMTFFLGVFDPITKRLTYVNASHDPPYLMPKLEEKLKKKHIVPLIDHTFPRLGESPESDYRPCEIQLNPGDRILFYTDGVTELKNANDDMFGERQLIKTMLASFNDGRPIDETINSINGELEAFRQGHPLDDDVTYFMIECR